MSAIEFTRRNFLSTMPLTATALANFAFCDGAEAQTSQPGPDFQSSRLWNSKQGTQVQAKFLAYSGDKVVVCRDDGRLIGTSFTNFSEADQKFVRGIKTLPHEPGIVKHSDDGRELVGRMYRYLPYSPYETNAERAKSLADKLIAFLKDAGMITAGSRLMLHYGFIALYETPENHRDFRSQLPDLVQPLSAQIGPLPAPNGNETAASVYRTLRKQISYNFANVSLSTAIDALGRLDGLKMQYAPPPGAANPVIPESLVIARERTDTALSRLINAVNRKHSMNLDWSMSADAKEIVICDRKDAAKLVFEFTYEVPKLCSSGDVRLGMMFPAACRNEDARSMMVSPPTQQESITIRAHPMTHLHVCEYLTALDMITKLCRLLIPGPIGPR